MNIFELSQKFLRHINSSCNTSQYLQVRNYAARKGTREKMRKKKVKVEVKKVGFIPHQLREKGGSTGPQVSRRLRDDYKGLPVDNVWVGKFYQWKVYDFQNAIECHRETHHPEMYNQPESPLQAFIELDMTGLKKNKYVDPFSRIAKVPHGFDHGEDRTILVFCKTPEVRMDAETAGATIVGDVDFVKKLERGETVLPDIQFVLAHPNILPEILCLRGILKRKFPNLKTGTLGPNIGEMVHNFRTGIQYWALRDEAELDYGWIDAPIGTLNMDKNHLEANFRSLIEDVLSSKPKRPGPFITRVLLKSPPSAERLKINLGPFIEEEDGLSSDSDEETTAAKAQS